MLIFMIFIIVGFLGIFFQAGLSEFSLNLAIKLFNK